MKMNHLYIASCFILMITAHLYSPEDTYLAVIAFCIFLGIDFAPKRKPLLSERVLKVIEEIDYKNKTLTFENFNNSDEEKAKEIAKLKINHPIDNPQDYSNVLIFRKKTL